MQPTADSTSTDREFFLCELARWKPTAEEIATSEPLSDQACLDYSKMWARRQYENFTVVSWLLPRSIQQDFYNVYAYCRWSDNLADEVSSQEESLRLLELWQLDLGRTPRGTPRHPVMRALQKTIQRHKLSLQPFLDLLAAFRQDRCQTRYRDTPAVLDYCQRSANPVGRILLSLAGQATPETIALSDQVCTGLQLANFCQDMSRDAELGRIYAPQDLMLKHGVCDAMVLQRRCTGSLQAMLQEWVQSTREYFIQGWRIVHTVPGWLATDLELFIRGGNEILNLIVAADFDVWTRRPVVSRARKIKLLGQALKGRVWGRPPELCPKAGLHSPGRRLP